jgi:uncharacterized repeat protein (TIGR01451 family)
MTFKIVIFVFFTVLVFGIGIASALSNSGGYDWKYYRVITIEENSGNALNDYQIFIELKKKDFPAEAKPDGSDIRFTKAIKELDMWIEEFDTNVKTAKIWVKVPNISANSEVKIRMYYGNEKAGIRSNKEAVMDFYDDFNDGTYTDKWEVAEGNWTQSKGTIMQIDNAKKALYAKDVAITDNIIIESKLRGYQIGVATRMNDSSNCWFYHIDIKYKNSVCVSIISDGNLFQTRYAPISNMNNRTWYIIRGTTLGPTAKAELFDSKWNILNSAAGYSDNETGNRVGLISAQNSEFDWFRVRKYTSPEPSTSISEEYKIKEIPSLTLTKSTSSFIIQEGENIIISNMVENTGYNNAINVEIVDTVPNGFEFISGPRSLFLERIEPGVDQNFKYSIKATEAGKFMLSPSTVIYQDDKDTVFFNESNPITIQVDITPPLTSSNITNETLLDNFSTDSSMEKKTSGFGTLLFIIGLLSAVYFLNRRPPSL